MSNIQIFSNPQFGEIRTAGTKEEPVFCLVDVCRVLELVPSKIAQRLSDDVLSKYPIVDSLNREQLANFVNEDGLYDVILDSRKPEAKMFRKWITSEVLPSIRKTGGYISFNQNMTDEEIMARAIMVAQATIQKREQEIKLLSEQKQQETIRANAAEAQIEEQMPKVVFADAIVGSRSSCLIGELAKIITQNGYSIGQNRLFAWMRENGYLGTKGEYYNIPNQRYIDQKIFEVKKTTHSENGIMKTTTTPKVTGKGQLYFINKFVGVNKILL